MNTDQKKLIITISLLITGIILGLAIGSFGLNLKTRMTVTVETSDPPAGTTQAGSSAEDFTATTNFSERIKMLETANGIAMDAAPTAGDTMESKVIMVEFADYQCPLCKKYFEESFIRIREDYIKTGKVLYAFRDFPLSSYPQTLITANAANCADEQGKFWEMHDLLLGRQNEWSFKDNARDILISYAKDLGVDIDSFTRCLDQEKYLQKIGNHITDGQKYQVTATPTIFINNKKIMGAQRYETFTQMIENELARPQPVLPGISQQEEL